MRILQLGKFYPIRGGIEKVMWDLTRGLNAEGVHCDMLCAVLGDALTLDMGGEGRCFCIHAMAKKQGTMIAPAMTGWLRRHHKEYDIIQIHHPDPMAALALRLSGYRGKVVLQWHSDVLKSRFFTVMYSPLQNWLIGRADVIVGTTPIYTSQSPDLAGVQEKIKCVPIGIEDDIRLPGVETDRKKVFALGRLVPYKGFGTLIEAARYLPDGYKVTIGGDGPLKDVLEDHIAKHSLGEKVTLCGYMSDGEVREEFNSCGVFCLSSSLKTEAFGIVQIEAMSCSKPVVATKVPESGISWVNEDGVSGLNVDPDDPQAMARAIVDLTSDDAVYAKFCQGARERFLEMFTIQNMVGSFRKLYEEVL